MDFPDEECAKVSKLVRGLLEKGRAPHFDHPRHLLRDRCPDRLRDRRHLQVQERLRPRELRRAELTGEPVGQVRQWGRPITKHGSPYLRRAIWLAASRAYQYDLKLKVSCDKKRREGKPHRVAVTAVARKLCNIVFAVMRDQAPYDPDR
jgi:hypothetical protein